MAVVEGDLVVEDGTGLSDANVYVTLAFATEYHRLLGNDLWANATEDQQCVALLRATQYINTRWVFIGVRANEDQSVLFPRYSSANRDGTDTSDTVPIEIQEACCEYALSVLNDGVTLIELSPVPDQSNGLSVILQRDKVGELESEVRYSSSVAPRTLISYPKADRIIKRSGYAANSGGAEAIR